MITAPVAVKICPDTADGKQIDKKQMWQAKRFQTSQAGSRSI